MAINPSTTSYGIAIANDGSQNYSITVLRNPGSQATGGTTVTQPSWIENADNGTNTTTQLIGVAVQAALRSIADDLSVNG